MNPGRTFSARLRQLQMLGMEPVVLIPCLELLEETLIDFQAGVMSDKLMLMDEKGRLATTLTPLLNAVRAARDTISASKQREDQPPPKRLHNSHYQ